MDDGRQNDTVWLTVERGNDVAQEPFTVQYATSDLTAKAGLDYEIDMHHGEMIAKACLMLPSSGADLALVDKLAEGALTTVVAENNP